MAKRPKRAKKSKESPKLVANSKPEEVRKGFRFSVDLWGKVERYRFENEFRTEQEAIVSLIEAGLANKSKKRRAA